MHRATGEALQVSPLSVTLNAKLGSSWTMQNSTEHAKYLSELNRQHALTAHERHHQAITDARKAAIDSATTAIRLMILVNGGAVVALLGFAGTIETGENGSIVTLSALAPPIMWFAVGVGFSALTAALAYLVNLLDADMLALTTQVWDHPYLVYEEVPKSLRMARNVLHRFAMVLAIGSLVAFFGGVIQVTDAITGFGI